jgi:hypothetical protein
MKLYNILSVAALAPVCWGVRVHVTSDKASKQTEVRQAFRSH